VSWTRRDPIDLARDALARQAEAEHPGWSFTHGIYGWSAVRAADSMTRRSASLPGVKALINAAECRE
jgi:hypothetical protein